MTAEELFNMFFGGGFPSQTVYMNNNNRRRTRFYYSNGGHSHENANQQEANNVTVALQILPILFFVFVTLISSFFVQDPLYSLSRTQKYAKNYEYFVTENSNDILLYRYNVKRATGELDVPYFVKETFVADFQGNLKRLEAGIEEEYIANLRNECFKQRNYKVRNERTAQL